MDEPVFDHVRRISEPFDQSMESRTESMFNASVILNARTTLTPVMTYCVDDVTSKSCTLITGPVDHMYKPSGAPTTLSDSDGLVRPQ